MTVAFALLAYWAGTGVLLAYVDITDSSKAWSNDGGGPGASTPTVVGGLNVANATALSESDLDAMTTTAIAAVRSSGVTQAIAGIDLRAPDGQQRVTLTLSGAGAGSRANFGPAGDAGPGAGARRIVVATPQGRIESTNAPPLQPGNDPEQSRHSLVKNWHRGSIGNGANGSFAPGNLLAFATGATLCVMVLTGFILYMQLWLARRRSGRREFFWSESRGGVLRKTHRWISVMAAVFLLNQSITGMLLAAENIGEQFHHGARHAARPYDFSDVELLSWLHETWRQARQASQAPIIAISLQKNDGEPFAPVFFGGEHAGAVGFKVQQRRYIFGASGTVGPGAAPTDGHSLMKRIHRGDVIGVFAGRYITLVAGLCFVYLVFSGIWMYLSLLRARGKTGRRSWFWK